MEKETEEIIKTFRETISKGGMVTQEDWLRSVVKISYQTGKIEGIDIGLGELKKLIK